jgi:hypothetical protein
MNRAMTFDDRKSALQRKEQVELPPPQFKPLVRRNTTYVEKKAEHAKDVHYNDLLYRRYFGESPGRSCHV